MSLRNYANALALGKCHRALLIRARVDQIDSTEFIEDPFRSCEIAR